MTEHITLNHGDKVHQGFFTAIQQLLGAATPSLRVQVLNSTTLTVVAGSGNDQVATAIGGKYRWRNSGSITATIGAITNGTGHVYATAADNNFSGPAEQPDAPTDYSFNIEIRASGVPITALYRKIGEVDVVAGAITCYRAWGGGRPSGEFPITGTSDHASISAGHFRAASGQTAPVLRVDDSTGVKQMGMSATGYLTLKQTLILFDGANNDQKVLSLNSSGQVGAALLANSNISASAAIDYSKLAALASTQILVGSSGNVPTARTLSGDATLSNTGVLTIGSAAITNSKIASGSIVNGHIDAAAGIAFSKLAALTSTQILVGSSGNVPTARTLSGDATLSNTGVLTIGAGAITDSKLAGNISHSKLASLASTQILVGSSGGVATARTMSGDATLSNTGVLTIGAGAINNSKIDGSAAIAFDKLASLGSTQILVGSGSGVPTARTVSGDATLSNTGVLTIASTAITNAKLASTAVSDNVVAAGAGIAWSKMASLPAAGILVGNNSNVAQARYMSGDGTLTSTGVLVIANDAIDAAKIQSGAVGTSEIGDAQVTSPKLSLTTDQKTAGAVTTITNGNSGPITGLTSSQPAGTYLVIATVSVYAADTDTGGSIALLAGLTNIASLPLRYDLTAGQQDIHTQTVVGVYTAASSTSFLAALSCTSGVALQAQAGSTLVVVRIG